MDAPEYTSLTTTIISISAYRVFKKTSLYFFSASVGNKKDVCVIMGT